MYQSVYAIDKNIGTTAHVILGYNVHRRAITFFSSPNDTYWLAPDVDPTSTSGIGMVAGCAPITISLETHGDVVHHEWRLIYSGGGNAIAWIETLDCPCEYDEAAGQPHNDIRQQAHYLGRLKR